MRTTRAAAHQRRRWGAVQGKRFPCQRLSEKRQRCAAGGYMRKTDTVLREGYLLRKPEVRIVTLPYKGGGMPLRDGTGPWGFGPGTGRGRGWCRTGMRTPFLGPIIARGRNRWLLGLAAPLIAAAIRDLANPKGLLRRIAVSLVPDKRMKEMRRINDTAHYTVIETSKKAAPDKTTSDNGNRNI
jgi:hypothetical protein